MFSNNPTGSRAASARGIAGLCAVLAMGLGLMARPAQAAPFAYVLNADDAFGESTSSVVIDTATNMVVATIPLAAIFRASGSAVAPDGKYVYVAFVGLSAREPGFVVVIDTATNTVAASVDVGVRPAGVAFAPDGKRAYVANSGFSLTFSTISVIDTATKMGVTTINLPEVDIPTGVAVTPDGKHVYVTEQRFGSVLAIDTATNTVVATVPVGSFPRGVEVAPDGKHVYVTDDIAANVSVIDTASNTVVATIPVDNPGGIAITPDGKHVYVPDRVSDTVSVIDTATNKVVATIPVDNNGGIAITPDGKHAYVTNFSSNSVSVIDTATNTVEAATIPVVGFPLAVDIVPPPPGVPFLAFNAKLAIQFGSIPTKDAFGFGSNFILSSTAPAIDPLTDPVTLQVGTFTATIPPGSFKKQPNGSFTFQGKIDGVGIGALIKQTGTLRYLFEAKGLGANLTGTVNTVYATLAIGGGSFSNANSGATSVTAAIAH